MDCGHCGSEFDPISTRWLCPFCKRKASCCEGAPLPRDLPMNLPTSGR